MIYQHGRIFYETVRIVGSRTAARNSLMISSCDRPLEALKKPLSDTKSVGIMLVLPSLPALAEAGV
jgi:hypothetical protein